jgi:recombinational DNA repair protein (RecF pathway)
MYAVDLTHHMLHDDDPHPTTFAALVDVLAALDGGGPKPPLRSGLAWGQALLRFQWAVIDDCGYRPMLDEPDRAESSTLLFSASSGGLVSGAKDQWKVRQTTVALLRRLSMDEATDDEPAEGRPNAPTACCVPIAEPFWISSCRRWLRYSRRLVVGRRADERVHVE